MRDSLAEVHLDPSEPRTSHSPHASLPTFDGWLADKTGLLSEYWHREVVRRSGVHDPAVSALLGEFLGFMASLVPTSVSVARMPTLDIWKRTAALYGSLGSIRGLAAGEVVEEMQVLREGILRVVFSEPPVVIGTEQKLREALRINRFVDLGVTLASVSHTDDLFFQLLDGNGVPSTPTPDLLTEIREQLENLMTEAEALRAS